MVAEAKRVCAVCPVRAECLNYADSILDYHGIWGGKTGRERGRKRDEF
ncbi:WhiB family transcriptional regulator [Mycobacteroides immunogenum]|nr:WhiB family transcriptional regulator [Mycobacteroides immunogenum]